MNQLLCLTAPLKDYLWGGTTLKTDYGKQTDLTKVAESWELSCHPDGMSVIQNGDFAGKTLADYLAAHPQAVGLAAAGADRFPVLIKLIDAADDLSIQVHPDNDYALRVEGEYGKTEMWYVVDATPDAALIYGFNRDLTTEEFESRIADGSLDEVIHAVPVKAGDVFFIEAGTLHGIGKGILIAEVQQNSNTTYRVHDYNRVGVDGKPRELHVQKAVEVTCLKKAPAIDPQTAGSTDPQGGRVVADCAYFKTTVYRPNTPVTLVADARSFHAILSVKGTISITLGTETVTLPQGQTVFVPAGSGDYTVKADTAGAECLLTTLGTV